MSKHPMSSHPTSKHYDALALFSGGLDSVLAAKVIQAQGLHVLPLHFVSPFFGHPHKISRWAELYSLEVALADISEDYARLIFQGPRHGFGKTMNPCVDCKILMLSAARRMLETFGATFIISGEVLGQRPMSQRRDTLNVIGRDSGTKGLLLRPLCARLMSPTRAEEAGLVDRDKLFAFSGRGRKDQLALAKAMGVTEFPAPGGGCRLTEKASCQRYWPVVKWAGRAPTADDFRLANLGRQLWAGPLWLTVARTSEENERVESLARPGDLLLTPGDYPGPVGLLRRLDMATCLTGNMAGPDRPFPAEVVRDAARLTAGFASKAVAMARETGREVAVNVRWVGLEGMEPVRVRPGRDTEAGFAEPAPWDEVKPEFKAWAARPGSNVQDPAGDRAEPREEVEPGPA